MEKQKKVTEWLEQAKADGYEWAQSAIEQTIEQYGQYRTLSLSGALFRAFDWGKSKEGIDYWNDIHDELMEKDL